MTPKKATPPPDDSKRSESKKAEKAEKAEKAAAPKKSAEKPTRLFTCLRTRNW